MAFIDLGLLKLNWQGRMETTTAYEVDDVVYYESQTFVATAKYLQVLQGEPQANLLTGT